VLRRSGKLRLGLAIGILLNLLLIALSSGAAQAQAQAANSRVRVAHLSPDAPNVDVYVNGNKTLSNVPFKAVSDYLSVPAGEYRFEVRAAGSAANSAAVIDAKATLESGKDYTVAATNLLASIKPLVLTDDNAAPAAGKAKVKVVHASPDAPAVDVAVKGGPVLVSNLAFGNASQTLTVDAATYDLEVRAAGTSTVALALNGTKLDAGKVYTVFAADRLAKITAVATAVDGVQVTTPPPAPNSRVRVAHLSPDAPNVDVYVNSTKTLSNVPFKAVSDYLSVPAGEYRFEVRPAGAAASSPAVIDAKATLESGKDYTVAAINLLASIKPLVLVDDNAAPASGQAKVKVVHGSPDAPAVDIAVKGGPVLVSNLAFGNASQTLSVPAGSYDLEVRAAGTSTVALALNGTKLDAGKVYTVFAADRLANISAVVTTITPTANACTLPGWTNGLTQKPALSQEFANTSNFYSTWARYDLLAPNSRSYTWGPLPFAAGEEPYFQGKDANGTTTRKRTILYWDKSRMEITDRTKPAAERDYVTNGLLVVELVTGRLQLGDALANNEQGVSCTPANVNVAGDPDDTNGPTYAAFVKRLGDQPIAVGALINQVIDRQGNVTTNQALATQYNVVGGYTEPATKHTIAKPFWDFLNRADFRFVVNGQTQTGKLYDPYWYVPGFPVSEAYWTKVKVGGQVKDVLVQAFERRVLTYTPSNPAGYQVEWGNVGQHYFAWRYGSGQAVPQANGN
jgi:hypothetical protein